MRRTQPSPLLEARAACLLSWLEQRGELALTDTFYVTARSCEGLTRANVDDALSYLHETGKARIMAEGGSVVVKLPAEGVTR